MPAGLVDPGESAETSAVRELKEETGYVGSVMQGGKSTGPLMWNGPHKHTSHSHAPSTMLISRTDPGMCGTTVKMIHLCVDLSLPENRHPKSQLEDGEFIECFTVPLRNIFEECRKLESQGYVSSDPFSLTPWNHFLRSFSTPCSTLLSGRTRGVARCLKSAYMSRTPPVAGKGDLQDQWFTPAERPLHPCLDLTYEGVLTAHS